ncbi:MAG: peptidylprolyl isomerase [Verrucomicrobiales bacterium]|nr:peptidylprolyl isomerase [Verrucomicrobiales bacterium]
MKKFIIVSAALALALATLPAADTKSETTAKKQNELFPDKVLVKGKGFEIKDSELEESFIAYKASLAARRESLPESKRESTEAQLLDRMILTKMLMQKATDADKKRAKETTDTFITKTKGQFESEEKFTQQLKAAGMSPAEFRLRMEEQATCEEVIERELKTKIKVADERVKKWYDEHPEKFQQSEIVRTSHILISTLDRETQQPLSATKKKEKEDQAKKLKILAERGGNFAELAKQNSDDPRSRDKGGELAAFARGQMGVPEYETAAFTMKTNQISDVIETQYGYHIIKLLEKLPAKKVPLSEVSEQLKNLMVDEELRDQMPDYFDKLKIDFKVEILDEKLRARVAEVNGTASKVAPPTAKK